MEKILIEYLEHLKIFGYSNNLAQVLINSIRDSGLLCRNVKGWWELKEHNTAYVFIIEHSLYNGHEFELKEEFEEKAKVID